MSGLDLHLAVLGEHREMTQFLLDKGADVNACNKYGNTTLHLAVRLRNTSIAQLLLQRGADAEARNVFGDTALHLAIYTYGGADMIDLLLENGADIHSRTAIYGSSVLHLANTADMVEYLCDHCSADVEARNKYGETPLYVAVQEHDIFLVDALLEHGADINTCDDFGDTPLRCARNQAMVDHLENHGAILGKARGSKIQETINRDAHTSNEQALERTKGRRGRITAERARTPSSERSFQWVN